MTISVGVAKRLQYKVESVFGTAPGASGAQILRRVTSDIALSKDTYQSNEINSNQQIMDFRHGVRHVTGNINGELSIGTYKDFMAAQLRGAWTAGATTGALITVAADSAGKTFTRSAGSFFTDGFKIGDVIRWTGWTAPATANNATNYRIVALTATVMTVAETVTTKTAGDSVTATVQGKKLLVPVSGQTNQSFSIEHWHSDINQSELFTGCRMDKMNIGLPATGMATIGFGVVGQNMTSGVASYYTTPSAETTGSILAAVNGVLRIGSTDIATVTGLTLSSDGGMSTDAVVGSNQTPDVFAGRVRVTGQLTAYFEDAVLRDAFLNETETSVFVKLNANTTANSDFLAINMSRVKLGGSSKSDGEKGLIQTIPFVALLNTAGGTGTAYDQTTISIQDTLA